MKAAKHEKAGIYFISLALCYLVAIFRSVKSTGNFRNLFPMPGIPSHPERTFQRHPESFSDRKHAFFSRSILYSCVLSPSAGCMRI